MHSMTAGNLRSAYGGEAMAHMRYLAWGEQARKEGFPNVARLFYAIAQAERVHASNHFSELKSEAGAQLVPSMAEFGLATTSRNLEGAIEGENFEVEEMYPSYLDTAKSQQERGAQLSFHYALSAEKIHAVMFRAAKQAVDSGADLELGPMQICEVCGYTAEGTPPDKCPICAAKKDQFTAYA